MKLFFTLVFLTASCSINILDAQISWSAEKDSAARNDIKMLKEGVLLVRLKTSEAKINALIKVGKAKEAQEIKAEQDFVNKDIAKIFKANFSFCKVYFFYSNLSDQVTEGKLNGILMNTELRSDTSFSGSNYLIGDFGEVANGNVSGFLIKDKKFVQLSKPFPYLAKQNGLTDPDRARIEMIKLTNSQLRNFWEESR